MHRASPLREKKVRRLLSVLQLACLWATQTPQTSKRWPRSAHKAPEHEEKAGENRAVTAARSGGIDEREEMWSATVVAKARMGMSASFGPSALAANRLAWMDTAACSVVLTSSAESDWWVCSWASGSSVTLGI